MRYSARTLSVAATLTLVFVSAAKAQDKNLVEVAVGNDDFSTLVTAVTEAGLAETLASGGPFTILAPTNEAFAKIPEDDLKAILADKELLTSILLYHVIEGEAKAADVVKLHSVETLQGGKLEIMAGDDGVKIGDANVLATDVMASNGVIHVIDTVLVPGM